MTTFTCWLATVLLSALVLGLIIRSAPWKCYRCEELNPAHELTCWRCGIGRNEWEHAA